MAIVANETKAQLAKRLKASVEGEEKARTEASWERDRAGKLGEQVAQMQTEFAVSMGEMKAQLESEVAAMKMRNAELEQTVSEKNLRVERLQTKLKWARDASKSKA